MLSSVTYILKLLLLILLFLVMFTGIACVGNPHQTVEGNGIDITFERDMAPQEIYDEDYLWFDVTNCSIIAYKADGYVKCFSLLEDTILSEFKAEPLGDSQKELYISGTNNPTLAITNIDTSVKFWDVLTGKLLFEGRLFENCAGEGIGFTTNGQNFYFDVIHNVPVVLCFDVRHGKVVWEKKYSYAIPTVALLSEDENSFVRGRVCLSGGIEIEAFDREMKTVWKKQFNEDYWFNLDKTPFLTVNRHSRQRVLANSTLLLNKKNILKSISLVDGKTIWNKKLNEGEVLCAVSHGKAKQAFWNNGTLEITSLPDLNSVMVQTKIEYLPDAVFTPDGRYLVFLPELSICEENKKENIRYIGRKTNRFTVIDCQTGGIINR